MHLATLALLTTLTAQAPPPAAPKQDRAPQTDQTVPVSRGARLSIDSYAGEVVIRGWEKDAVRVQATHKPGTTVDIQKDASLITINASTNPPHSPVDYEITAPTWMPMKIEGQYIFVTVEGIQGELSVTTVRGDIVLRNVSSATAKTIKGAIEVDGARGRMALSSVNEDIKIAGTSGDLSADTTNGSITLERVESTNVQITTVNGDITFDGSVADKGHYSFATHNGDITMTVPATVNATFTVRTYSGEFVSSLPAKGPDPAEVRRGRRVTYTLGTGSAEVEMESFGGEIRLRRAGSNRSGRN
jgi:DUF4097 and DUF4098 domain-containing protein YvlB